MLDSFPSPSGIGDAEAMNRAVCRFMHQNRRITPKHRVGMLAEVEARKIHAARSKPLVVFPVSKRQLLVDDVFELRANPVEAPGINPPYQFERFGGAGKKGLAGMARTAGFHKRNTQVLSNRQPLPARLK